jgi:hypothetical protein
MTAYDPAAWHDFCVAFAGASGALLGLAFVAISFNLDAIIADNVLPGRAVETLIFFAYPLASSLLVLAPRPIAHGPRDWLGHPRRRTAQAGAEGRPPRWQHERAGPLAWRLGHAAPGSLLTTLAVIAALATITTSIGGLYWLGGAMAVPTSAGLINSWALVEIKR